MAAAGAQAEPFADIKLERSQEGIESAKSQANALCAKGSRDEVAQWYSKATCLVEATAAHGRGLLDSVVFVPFQGIRPPASLKADAERRLQRLLKQGDVHGARRMLARAQGLGTDRAELHAADTQLQELEAAGELRLLFREKRLCARSAHEP